MQLNSVCWCHNTFNDKLLETPPTPQPGSWLNKLQDFSWIYFKKKNEEALY